MSAIQAILSSYGVQGSSGGPITQVQASATQHGSSAASFVYTWTTAPTAGNRIILVITTWSSGGGAPTVTVTDNAGNSYTVRATQSSGTTRTSIVECTVGTAPTTTTVTFSTSLTYYGANFSEWSGIVAYDTNALATGSTSSSGAQTFSVGPTAALANANSLVITSLATLSGMANSAISAPSGYTALSFEQDASTYIGMGSAYKVVAATTAVSATWPFSSLTARAVTAAIAVFRGN